MTRGIALVVTLIALAVLSALGLGLVLVSSTERLTAGNYRDALDALYAAEAALDLAARELGQIAGWNGVLSGGQRSRFVDGPAGGWRRLDGMSFNLTTLTEQLKCGRAAGCTDARIRVSTTERPWGANNPKWELFLFGPLDAFVRAPRPFPPAYVIVWLGDDRREVDGDPLSDGGGPAGEGRDVLRARAEALAPGGARRAIEADLSRRCETIGGTTVCSPGIHVQSWRLRTSALP